MDTLLVLALGWRRTF